MIDKAPSSYEEGALLFSIKKALTTKNDFLVWLIQSAYIKR